MMKLTYLIITLLLISCITGKRYSSPAGHGFFVYTDESGPLYLRRTGEWIKDSDDSQWRRLNSDDVPVQFSYAVIGTNLGEGKVQSFTVNHYMQDVNNSFTFPVPDADYLLQLIPKDQRPNQSGLFHSLDLRTFEFTRDVWDGESYIITLTLNGSMPSKLYAYYSWKKNLDTGADEISFLHITSEHGGDTCTLNFIDGKLEINNTCIHWDDGQIVYKEMPIDDSASFIHYQETLIKFARENKSSGSISLNFAKTTRKGGRYAYSATIDENNNLHLIYTTNKMVKNEVEHYVQYSFFYHDDPLTPYYSQKLYLSK